MENKNNLTKEEDLVLKIATEILEKYKIAFEELAKWLNLVISYF